MQGLQAFLHRCWMALLPGGVIGIFGVFQLESNPAGAIKDILEGVALIAGVIGAAYVLRSKVGELEEWRDKQDERTDKIQELVIELASETKSNRERIKRLEVNEDESNRQRRPRRG